MTKLINPPRYEFLLKGSAPCNYSMNSQTLYRTLAVPEDQYHVNQVEKFLKYDYDTIRMDFAFRTFDQKDDDRMYNIFLVTDKGIFREDVTRSIWDTEIYMRWTAFWTKLENRFSRLVVLNKPDSKAIDWFYLREAYEYADNMPIQVPCGICNPQDYLFLVDTNGKVHYTLKNDKLYESIRYGTDYIEVDKTNYIPIWQFHCWYQYF